MKKFIKYFFTMAILGSMVVFQSCKKDDGVEAPKPSARFETKQDANDPLKFTFDNVSLNATSYAWTFGDGETSTEKSPTHTYAKGGIYTVILTATGDGGSHAREESISALTPKEKLTGTEDAGKTWGLVREGLAITLHPTGDFTTTWWSFGDGGAAAFSERDCLLTDSYTFKPDGKYEYKANGFVYAEEPWGGDKDFSCLDENEAESWIGADGADLSGWKPGVRDFAYDFDNDKLTLSGMGAHIGLFKVGNNGSHNDATPTDSPLVLNVLKLEDVDGGVDTLRISVQYIKADGADITWIYTYVSYDNPNDEPVLAFPPRPNFSQEIDVKTVTFTNTTSSADSYSWDFGDGETSTDENPVHTYVEDGTYTVTLTATNANGSADKVKDITVPLLSSLLIDFESNAPTWGGFGGNITGVVADNPNMTGNGSANVLQIDQAAGVETWAGIVTTLVGKINLSSKQTFTIKVYAPAIGQTFKLKLEASENGDISQSIDATTTKAGEWEELTFVFDAANTGKFDKVVLFPNFGGDKSAASVYYVDDITF